MAKKVTKVKVVRTPQGVRRVKSQGAQPKQVKQQRVSAATQAQAAQNQALVTIEDTTIQMILADPRYTATIPCLQSGKNALSSVGRRCGRCSRKRKQLRSQAMTQIKSCIAGLRGQNATDFKKLLGAKKVRVYQNNGKGRAPTPITF